MMQITSNLILEQHTDEFIEKLKSQGGEPIYKLTPQEARNVLEQLQAKPGKKPQVKIEDKKIPVGTQGQVSIRIIRPQNTTTVLPVVLYIHGAGWIMGSIKTHDRLICELAEGANAAIVFVNYSLSPESRFPTAIEESYAVLKYIAENGKQLQLDTAHIAVAGDSVGGNMAIAITQLAKERNGPKICAQVLFYPVTDASLDSNSYKQFADGPWLTKKAMEWFWDAYEPDVSARNKPLLSPINIPADQLKGMPRALVISAEYDVLRDEGEAYAHKLMQAGVDVTAIRFEGTIHDFAMLNALAETPAARGAIAFACSYLSRAWRS